MCDTYVVHACDTRALVKLPLGGTVHVRCEVTSVTILFLCVSSAGVAEVAPHEAGAGSVEVVTGGLGEGEEGGGVVEAEDATGHQHRVLINWTLILTHGSRSANPCVKC